jgi:transitional endoplasmic reticulum ATPase
MIFQSQHAKEYERMGLPPATGTLLYGPSGCGKTLFVHALASSLPVPFLSIKGYFNGLHLL